MATHAERLGVNISKIEKVGGQLPKNWDFAGKDFTFDPASKFAKSEAAIRDPELAKRLFEKYPNGVHFTEKGFAEFDPYVVSLPDGRKADFTIELTGSRGADFSQADKLAGITERFRNEKDLVWNHHHDVFTQDSKLKGRAQLVPRDIHRAVRHTGGCATSGLKYED